MKMDEMNQDAEKFRGIILRGLSQSKLNYKLMHAGDPWGVVARIKVRQYALIQESRKNVYHIDFPTHPLKNI